MTQRSSAPILQSPRERYRAGQREAYARLCRACTSDERKGNEFYERAFEDYDTLYRLNPPFVQGMLVVPAPKTDPPVYVSLVVKTVCIDAYDYESIPRLHEFGVFGIEIGPYMKDFRSTHELRFKNFTRTLGGSTPENGNPHSNIYAIGGLCVGQGGMASLYEIIREADFPRLFTTLGGILRLDREYVDSGSNPFPNAAIKYWPLKNGGVENAQT